MAGCGGARAPDPAEPAVPVASERGSVRGTVAAIDLPRGRVSVSSGGTTVALRATPEQLAALRVGQLVSLQYASWGDQRWIEGLPGIAVPARAWAEQATVAGAVRAVDKAAGQVLLDRSGVELSFRGPPDALQPLVPGEYVRLTYRQIGTERWVTRVAPERAPGG